MKELKPYKERPTQPLPPKHPKRPEEGIVRILLGLGTLLVLYLISQYIP